MFSTIALVKNSKFSGKVVGTHQKLAQAARMSLGQELPRGKFFPSSKEIIHFEGSRGPDGLKRKSPGEDEPSYMLTDEDYEKHKREESDDERLRDGLTLAKLSPASESGHENLDERSVITMIMDHRWNLVQALKKGDRVRAAFEAAWMEHAIVDGLTPAHHFPLSEVKDELMTDKELVRVFGAPIKGMMHGRSMLETMRNNWLYWGAGGHMSRHIAYEYGVLMIATTISPKTLSTKLTAADLEELDTEKMFCRAYDRVRQLDLYTRFNQEGWTTDLALETKEILLPEMVRAVALGWYSAAAEAYGLGQKVGSGKGVVKTGAEKSGPKKVKQKVSPKSRVSDGSSKGVKRARK